MRLSPCQGDQKSLLVTACSDLSHAILSDMPYKYTQYVPLTVLSSSGGTTTSVTASGLPPHSFLWVLSRQSLWYLQGWRDHLHLPGLWVSPLWSDHKVQFHKQDKAEVEISVLRCLIAIQWEVLPKKMWLNPPNSTARLWHGRFYI